MKYFGFIEKIEDDFVTTRLQEENSLFKYYLDLPINMINNEYLHLGQTFHVNLPDDNTYHMNELNIEWIENHKWIQEELAVVEKQVEKYMKLFPDSDINNI